MRWPNFPIVTACGISPAKPSKRTGRYGAIIFLHFDNFQITQWYSWPRHRWFTLHEKPPIDEQLCTRSGDCCALWRRWVRCHSLRSWFRRFLIQQAGQYSCKQNPCRFTLKKPYILNIDKNSKCGNAIEHQCTSSIGVALFLSHQSITDEVIKWARLEQCINRKNPEGIGKQRDIIFKILRFNFKSLLNKSCLPYVLWRTDSVQTELPWSFVHSNLMFWVTITCRLHIKSSH